MTVKHPETAPNVAALAASLADPTRAMICVCLLDGRAWTVTELSTQLRVAKSSASEHVSQLVNGGILTERRQGRHRYVQIASHAIADWLEHTGGLASDHLGSASTMTAKRRDKQLADARTCYKHLAGLLGVQLASALSARGWVDGSACVTADGRTGMRDLWNIEVPDRVPTGRHVSIWCLDWTERRSHLGGWLGDELCRVFLDRRWIKRRPNSRAVSLTDEGRSALPWVLEARERHL